MKTFENRAAQGDLFIRRVDKLPAGVTKVIPEQGRHTVAHSETGHSHIIKDAPNVTLYTTGDPMISYLEVIEATDATETLLEHLRSYDTHETIKIPAGVFEIRRQREYTPEGWRQVAD
jgi:hypothetical protein